MVWLGEQVLSRYAGEADRLAWCCCRHDGSASGLPQSFSTRLAERNIGAFHRASGLVQPSEILAGYLTNPLLLVRFLLHFSFLFGSRRSESPFADTFLVVCTLRLTSKWLTSLVVLDSLTKSGGDSVVFPRLPGLLGKVRPFIPLRRLFLFPFYFVFFR